MYKWLKNNIREMFYSLVVSIIVASIFITYIYFVGIPKTKARNEYNKAVIELKLGNEDAVEMHLENALNHWNEKYIRETLLELEESN